MLIYECIDGLKEAGLPIGGPDFNPYVMLEVHYNNPSSRGGTHLHHTETKLLKMFWSIGNRLGRFVRDQAVVHTSSTEVRRRCHGTRIGVYRQNGHSARTRSLHINRLLSASMHGCGIKKINSIIYTFSLYHHYNNN